MAQKIITGLGNVESRLRDKNIRFLHVDIDHAAEISVSSVPSLVYFKNGDPVIYNGKYIKCKVLI